MRLGLALSGGGFRATLFHLGVVRCLCDAGLLGQVRHVTSVSGGSVLAAHLVRNWGRYLDAATFDRAAEEIRDLARYDLRGRILRRVLTHFPLTYLRHRDLLRFPPRLRRQGTTRTLLLESYLARRLVGDATLAELSEGEGEPPILDVLATNLTRGTQSYFAAGRFVPDDQDGAAIETRTRLARAVTISAAFPGFFPTVEISAAVLAVDVAEFGHVDYLTDGGVFDNLGLRRFRTVLAAPEPPVDHVIVCDASGHFDWLIGREVPGLLKTAIRSSEILMKRLADVEREIAMLDDERRFTQVRISDRVEAGGAAGGLPVVVQRQVRNVRTDLDRFSELEIETLERHGYAVAEARLAGLTAAEWQRRPPPLSARRHADPDRVAAELRRSGRRRSRAVSLRDWISYLHLALLAVLLAVPGAWLWSAHQKAAFFAYLDSLDRDSFGLLAEISEPGPLFSRLEDARRRWPDDPEVGLEIALDSYSLFNQLRRSGGHSAELERAFGLLGLSLDSLGDPEALIAEQRRIYYQLAGHHQLERGRRLKRKGRREEASDSFSQAYASYSSYRKLGFDKLYALEYNLCNAALDAGWLEIAADHCRRSHRYAQEQSLHFWQPKFLLADIAARNGDVPEAAQELVEAHGLAVPGGEKALASFLGYVETGMSELDALCREASVLQAMPSVCQGRGGGERGRQ